MGGGKVSEKTTSETQKSKTNLKIDLNRKAAHAVSHTLKNSWAKKKKGDPQARRARG